MKFLGSGRELNVEDSFHIVQNLLPVDDLTSHWQAQLDGVEGPVGVPHVESEVRARFLYRRVLHRCIHRFAMDAEFFDWRERPIELLDIQVIVAMQLDDRQLRVHLLQVYVQQSLDLSVVLLVLRAELALRDADTQARPLPRIALIQFLLMLSDLLLLPRFEVAG